MKNSGTITLAFVIFILITGFDFVYKKIISNKWQTMKNLGIVMIVLGIIMMVITGFNFITKEKVLDVGPLEVHKEERHPVQWPPVAGAVLLAGGIILVIAGRRTVKT